MLCEMVIKQPDSQEKQKPEWCVVAVACMSSSFKSVIMSPPSARNCPSTSIRVIQDMRSWKTPSSP